MINIAIYDDREFFLKIVKNLFVIKKRDSLKVLNREDILFLKLIIAL
ncbi:hypothetical protein [Clostridium sp.]